MKSGRRFLELAMVVVVVAVLAVYLRPPPPPPEPPPPTAEVLAARAQLAEFIESSTASVKQTGREITLGIRLLKLIEKLRAVEFDMEDLKELPPSPERDAKMEELEARKQALYEVFEQMLEDAQPPE